MGIFEAIVLAIVEGIAEVMPVSANGHLAVMSSLLQVNTETFTPYYTDLLQFGVMGAILYLYWKRFTKVDTSGFYKKLLFGSLPAIVFFVLFSGFANRYLLTYRAIAFTLIMGGVFFLFIDFIFRDSERSIKRISRVTSGNALVVGLWQVLGIVPGLGRTAAAIFGGLQQGMTRTMATEFAFFVSVPTLFFLGVYKVISAMISNPAVLRENASTLAI
ncbi:MAG: undecaprenyl-diphosphate phosphatase, partial [Bacteroidetes bacterium]